MPGQLRSRFARQLSHWFYNADWHYTTLLANAILAIQDPPDDIDELVNRLLAAFPLKPAYDDIYRFINQHPLLIAWFRYTVQRPKITLYCLSGDVSTNLIDRDLPRIQTINELQAWSGISSTQLNWLCDTKRHDSSTPSNLRHYHYHCINKRRGGVRFIESPKSLLKSLQRKISKNIIRYAPVHDAAYGFRTGQSCMTHASNHCGKKYLLVFDITHYFQSINWLSVFHVFRNLGYDKPVSIALANLCTHQCRYDVPEISLLEPEQRQRIKQRHLAQGAPSSPALSNAVMLKLDNRLSGLADSLGLSYTRYADDLAFSTNQQRNWNFLEPLVGSICREEGFLLNFKKSRQKAGHQRQKLVGIIINNKPNIDRRYFDQLKAVLTNCIRYGAYSQNRFNHPDFAAYLYGRIQYVSTLNPQKADKLKMLFKKISFTDRR